MWKERKLPTGQSASLRFRGNASGILTWRSNCSWRSPLTGERALPLMHGPRPVGLSDASGPGKPDIPAAARDGVVREGPSHISLAVEDEGKPDANTELPHRQDLCSGSSATEQGLQRGGRLVGFRESASQGYKYANDSLAGLY
jgi:hypothetical protein